MLGVTPETFEAYELGERMISLPELELAAYFLDTPLEHFWEKEPSITSDYPKQFANREQLIRLRNRMIGAILRQARLESGLSLEELAKKTDLSLERLQAYEWGQEAAPIPELEILCSALQRSIREFQDEHGPVGEWNSRQHALRRLHGLTARNAGVCQQAD